MGLIAVEEDAIKAIRDQLNRLEQRLNTVQITPPPAWITISEYAETVGRSEATVRRWIRQGRVERKGTLVPNPNA